MAMFHATEADRSSKVSFSMWQKKHKNNKQNTRLQRRSAERPRNHDSDDQHQDENAYEGVLDSTSTPFAKYLLGPYAALIVDVARLSDEQLEMIGNIMKRSRERLNTVMVHDSYKCALRDVREGAWQPRVRRFQMPSQLEIDRWTRLHVPSTVLANASTLKHLELQGISPTGMEWNRLFNALACCTSLEMITIADVNLSQHIHTLQIALQHLSVYSIALVNCQLQSNAARSLSRIIEDQSNRRDMLQWESNLRRVGPTLYQRSKLDSRGLTSLRLRDNHIGDDGIVWLCDTLSRDVWIQAIDLRGNAMSAKGAAALAEMLKSNRTLVKLLLDSEFSSIFRDDPHAQRRASNLKQPKSNDTQHILLPIFDLSLQPRQLFHRCLSQPIKSSAQRRRCESGVSDVLVKYELNIVSIDELETRKPHTSLSGLFDSKFIQPKRAGHKQQKKHRNTNEIIMDLHRQINLVCMPYGSGIMRDYAIGQLNGLLQEIQSIDINATVDSKLAKKVWQQLTALAHPRPLKREYRDRNWEEVSNPASTDAISMTLISNPTTNIGREIIGDREMKNLLISDCSVSSILADNCEDDSRSFQEQIAERVRQIFEDD